MPPPVPATPDRPAGDPEHMDVYNSFGRFVQMVSKYNEWFESIDTLTLGLCMGIQVMIDRGGPGQDEDGWGRTFSRMQMNAKLLFTSLEQIVHTRLVWKAGRVQPVVDDDSGPVSGEDGDMYRARVLEEISAELETLIHSKEFVPPGPGIDDESFKKIIRLQKRARLIGTDIVTITHQRYDQDTYGFFRERDGGGAAGDEGAGDEGAGDDAGTTDSVDEDAEWQDVKVSDASEEDSGHGEAISSGWVDIRHKFGDEDKAGKLRTSHRVKGDTGRTVSEQNQNSIGMGWVRVRRVEE